MIIGEWIRIANRHNRETSQWDDDRHSAMLSAQRLISSGGLCDLWNHNSNGYQVHHCATLLPIRLIGDGAAQWQ